MRPRKLIVSKRQNGRKRAVSAVIGGIIVFLIIFTTVAAFFVFDYNTRTSVDQSANQRAIVDQLSASENFFVAGFVGNGGLLYANVTNTGPYAIQITAIIVGNGSSDVVLSMNSAISAANGVIDPGQTSVFDTNYIYTNGVVWIKAVTTLGTIRITLYPLPTNPSTGILGALTAGAIGDLYLDFESYTYYEIVGCTAPDPSYSNFCLQLPGNQAFSIPASSAKFIGFSVRVTNYNPQHLTITLDSFTDLFQFWPAGSSFRGASWFVVSNDSSGHILNTYVPQVLPYNVTTVLVFADGIQGGNCNQGNPCIPANPFTTENTGSGSSAIPNPGLASTFIFAHGWKNETTSSLTNYGQNIPFVTTEYYS